MTTIRSWLSLTNSRLKVVTTERLMRRFKKWNSFAWGVEILECVNQIFKISKRTTVSILKEGVTLRIQWFSDPLVHESKKVLYCFGYLWISVNFGVRISNHTKELLHYNGSFMSTGVLKETQHIRYSMLAFWEANVHL